MEKASAKEVTMVTDRVKKARKHVSICVWKIRIALMQVMQLMQLMPRFQMGQYAVFLGNLDAY